MRSLIGVLSICIFVSIIHAQDSISISDFRYPETRAIDWKAGISGSFQNQNVDQDRGGGQYLTLPYSRESSVGTFSLGNSFLFFHSKDNHDQNFQLTSSVFFNNNSRDEAAVDSNIVLNSEEHNTTWSENISTNWSYLHYFAGDGIHFLSSITASYNGYQRRTTTSSNYQAAGSTEENVKDYDIHFSGTLGIGYGRVRDGTFVFRAMRVIERLRDDGAFIAPLQKSQLDSVINRIARRREYTTNFERYEKYFIQDVIDELIRSGIVSAQHIAPYSTLRILEAFTENIRPRLFGWRVYYSFLDSHDQSFYESEKSSKQSAGSTYHSFSNDWIYMHRFGAEIGHPVSLATHLHADVMFDIPIHDVDRRWQLNVNAAATYELGERIEVIASYQFRRSTAGNYRIAPEQFSRTMYQTIGGNFVYFLEDHLRFNVSMGFSKSNSNYFGSYSSFDPSSYESSGLSFSFGLNYNIM